MNTTQGIPLADFCLDERTYARSKLWSNMLNQYSCLEDSEELSIETIDSFWQNPEEPSDIEEEESASEDSLNKSVELETEEDENEHPAFDRSVLQIRNISKTLAKKRYKMTKDILAAINEEENNLNLDDFLNQTIPIIKEHERKWKESGMLRVMNTFDEKKIEEKVGNWLRNKSAQCENSYQPIAGQSLQPVHEQRISRFSYAQPPDSEDESMHSMDTARYVLSNRKPRNSNSTTIKTFRLVKSKRDALREKYAFPEDELEEEHGSHRKHRHALNGRHLVFDANRVRSTPISFRPHMDLKLSKESHCIRRKPKVLSKRREPKHHSSSSDDDEDISNFCPYDRRKRAYSACVSSPTAMYASPARSMQLVSKRVFQSMPRKRESECQCCSSGRLCDTTMHLADTSTEEWVVMNCTPSKKPPGKTKLTDKRKKKETTDISKKAEKVTKTKSKSKITKKKKDQKEPPGKEEPLDDTFERDLKLALQLSKQMHDSDVKKKNKTSVSKNNNYNKIKTKKPASRKGEAIADLNMDPNGNSSDEEREESLKVNNIKVNTEPSDNKENNKHATSIKEIPGASIELADSPKLDSSLEKSIKPRPKSQKLKKLEKLRQKIFQTNPETTLFSGNICNSTAITNKEVAVSKQLSSSNNSLRRNSKESGSQTTPTIDPDCTVVSSTTGDPKLIDFETPQNRKSNKGILIYTPHNRNLAPAESFSNGVFNITEEHLSSVIGEKAAHKFLKYYVGRKRFADNLTIYFRPPSNNVDVDKDTDSEDDELQLVGRYGDLHACLEK